MSSGASGFLTEIEADVEELEKLLLHEQIKEIWKDVPKRGSIKDELNALRKKWGSEQYISVTAHNIALKRKHGEYSPVDRRMDRHYERHKGMVNSLMRAKVGWGIVVLLGFLVLL